MRGLVKQLKVPNYRYSLLLLLLLLLDILIFILKKCHCNSVPHLLIGRKYSLTADSGRGVVSPYTPLDEGEGPSPWQQEEEVPLVDGVSEEGLLLAGGVINELLIIFKRTLTKNDWKEHPNEKHTLIWCLKHLKVSVHTIVIIIIIIIVIIIIIIIIIIGIFLASTC